MNTYLLSRGGGAASVSLGVSLGLNSCWVREGLET